MPITRAAKAASKKLLTQETKKRSIASSEKVVPREIGNSRNSSSDSKSSMKPTKRSKKETSKATKSSSESNSDTLVSSNLPWYHIFTKGDADYNLYMAQEWSFETRGDQALFERLTLEGAQSGLSWLTILRKRTAYRTTFFNFDIERVANMTQVDVDCILNSNDENPRNMIVRHGGKIESVIRNAQCIRELQRQAQDPKHALDHFLWSFVDHQPILNHFGGERDSETGVMSLKGFPTQTPESQAMSKALKKKGFKFVGPTTCYALMQAVGMVIDHPVDSPEWQHARERLEKREGGYQDRPQTKRGTATLKT